MIKRFLVLIVFCACHILCYSQDYSQYHLSIIKAEKQIFVDSQLSKGLDTYNEVLGKYDFVFLQDCVIAMQIALFANNEKQFLAFAQKAFQNGLTLKHLEFKGLSYLQSHPIYAKNKDKMAEMFIANRQHYLKRIDTVTLKTMIRLYAYDQLSKNGKKGGGESHRAYTLRYGPLVRKTMEDVIAIINNKGFPGDKMIGMSQDDIMKELKQGGYDAMDYYNRNKDDADYNAGPGQFRFDTYNYASTLYFPIVIHYMHQHGTDRHKKNWLLHSDEFFMNQIKLGNIHPKDLAFLYDFPILQGKAGGNDTAGVKIFHVHFEKEDLKGIDKNAINRNREAYFIAPIENDIAKERFIKRHRMHHGGGWWGCRS